MLSMILEWCWDETNLKNQNLQKVVRIDSITIYTDLNEYKNVGDTEAPLLRCFFLTSKLKAGDITTIGQYLNYQTFSNLHIRPLL